MYVFIKIIIASDKMSTSSPYNLSRQKHSQQRISATKFCNKSVKVDCFESTGCTKGLLIDNNKSNISNESTMMISLLPGVGFETASYSSFLLEFLLGL